jgi:ABC-type sugar transport system, ATPase component
MIAMERSVGVLLVDHKLDEVFRYSQRIFVIANGKRILEGTAESLTRQAVVDAIVGSHFEEHRYLSTSNDTIASLHPAVPVDRKSVV